MVKTTNFEAGKQTLQHTHLNPQLRTHLRPCLLLPPGTGILWAATVPKQAISYAPILLLGLFIF